MPQFAGKAGILQNAFVIGESFFFFGGAYHEDSRNQGPGQAKAVRSDVLTFEVSASRGGGVNISSTPANPTAWGPSTISSVCPIVMASFRHDVALIPLTVFRPWVMVGC